MIKRAPLQVPPAVTKAVIDDMHAYFAEDDKIKREAIAVVTMSRLSEHLPARNRIRLNDVIELFKRLKDDPLADAGTKQPRGKNRK